MLINHWQGTPAAKWLMDLFTNKNNAHSLLLKRYSIDSEKRNLKNEKLIELAVYLKKNAMAGYQEMLINELISDIRKSDVK